MITVANALLAALAHLQTQQAGHTISMPAKCCKREEIADWCEKHGLRWWLNGPTLTLQMIVDGEQFVPPDPTIPPVGTPIDNLHPGNRFRLMAGLPLLPEKPNQTTQP